MPIINFTHDRSRVPADAVALRETIEHRTHWNTNEPLYGPFVLYTWHTHVGLCLADREVNGRDDSDFYMKVWNEEKGAPEEIMFASTRGWSYPAMGSSVDATPEVRAKYEAYQAAMREESRKRHEARSQAIPVKGKAVKLVRKHKVKGEQFQAGDEGVVIWFGDQRNFGPALRYPVRDPNAGLRAQLHSAYGDLREGKRVGVRFKDGRTAFMAATLVEVVGSEGAFK